MSRNKLPFYSRTRINVVYSQTRINQWYIVEHSQSESPDGHTKVIMVVFKVCVSTHQYLKRLLFGVLQCRELKKKRGSEHQKNGGKVGFSRFANGSLRNDSENKNSQGTSTSLTKLILFADANKKLKRAR